MGNLHNNPKSKSEGHRMFRSLFKYLAHHSVFILGNGLSWTHLTILFAMVVQSGCASLNLFKKEEDEYSRARNEINGYSDSEGNWIRPEGSRADKSRESNLTNESSAFG